jgi:hypothetical protein
MKPRIAEPNSRSRAATRRKRAPRETIEARLGLVTGAFAILLVLGFVAPRYL